MVTEIVSTKNVYMKLRQYSQVRIGLGVSLNWCLNRFWGLLGDF